MSRAAPPRSGVPASGAKPKRAAQQNKSDHNRPEASSKTTAAQVQEEQIGSLGGIPITVIRSSFSPSGQFSIHPIALKFPSLPPEEFEALKESIRQHGQFEPIVVSSDGQVLDGRHRYDACRELGIEPLTIPFEKLVAAGDAKEKLTVEEFIFDSNMKRRHLTESQRAAVAAEFANMRQGERTDLEPSDNCPKVSQGRAARLLEVSSKSVGRAKKVKEKDPATFSKVKSGDLSLNAAVKLVEPEQKVDSYIVPQTSQVEEPKEEQAAKDPKPDRRSERQRWKEACEFTAGAIEELIELQDEYKGRFDELSERQQESERGEILSAICDLDLEGALSTIEEALGIDLP